MTKLEAPEISDEIREWAKEHGYTISEQTLPEALAFLDLPREGKTPEETIELLKKRAQGYIKVNGEGVIPFLNEDLKNALQNR